MYSSNVRRAIKYINFSGLVELEELETYLRSRVNMLKGINLAKNSLATCPEQPVACPSAFDMPCNKEAIVNNLRNRQEQEQSAKADDMETNMLTSYNNLSATAALPTEQVQMDFLRGEARNVRETLYSKLRKQFGLSGDPAPETVEDFIKRIQDGKFVLEDMYKQKRTSYVTDYISWRDPSIKRDEAGYDAAKELLDAKYRDTKRAIMTQGADAGLKAVLDLEAFRG